MKHDSPEWQGAIQDIATLKGDVSAIKERITQQAKQQDERHKDNQERFKELEDKIQTVQTEVTALKDVIIETKGVLEGLKKAAQALAWVIGIVGGMLTIGIGINTLFGPSIRRTFHLPTANSTHPAMQGELRSQEPFDATLPPSTYVPSERR